MNILPIVFSLLLLLSLVTMSRLQSYGISKLLFKHKTAAVYADLNERNLAERRLFAAASADSPTEMPAKDTSKNKNNPKGKGFEKPSIDRVDATKKINLFPIFNRENASLSPIREIEYRTLFKNLLEVMFQEERFYKEALERSSNIVDRLIDAFSTAIALDKSYTKVEAIKKFRNLRFNDPELEQFRYFIFAGKESFESLDQPENGSTSTILDLIEYNPNIKPIRLYLARKEVLMAIYMDAECVDEIIKKREALYREVRKNLAVKDEVSGDFERTFAPRRPAWMDAMSLNYKITTTDPKAK